MSFTDVRDVMIILGVIIAVFSLGFTACNTQWTFRTNRARFWLELRDHFAKHDEVHRRLRPGGVWASGKGPANPDDWANVEAYMGLFEHCEYMLDQRLIDESAFREIYAYRLRNIVANDIIRQQKLNRLASEWQRLLALLKRMKIELSS